jgi:hypothetical protein
VPALGLNQRQRGPDLAEARAALAGLRTEAPDDVGAALRRLAADGHLHVHDTSEDLLTAVVEEWYQERTAGRRGPAGRSRMMAEQHRDTELLNAAACVRLHADGTLRGPVLAVAGREFQVGDEVITLTQAGHTLVPAGKPRSAFIRTGTIGVITEVHLEADQPGRHALTVRFPHKGETRIGWEYLTHAFPDGRDGGLAHAYALTAHKAEGATMPTARTLATDDTSRAGLYVMLSRGRDQFAAHVIRRRDLEYHFNEDEDWLPILDDTGTAMRRLTERLERSRPQRLAAEHDPIAHAAHRLQHGYDLAALAEIRDQVITRQRSDLDLLVVRRAEQAAEATLTAAAVTDPPAALLERIGTRPPAGPARAAWDQAVAAVAIYHARHRPHLEPGLEPHEPGSEPQPRPEPDTATGRWRDIRAAAEALAAAWATQLDDDPARRFTGRREALPRDRAVAGIHALLDAGWPPDQLAAELLHRDTGDVRSGAAVLDHRVRYLLDGHDIDPTAYTMPPPLTAAEEWAHVSRLLAAAQTHHTAHRAGHHLAALPHHATAEGTRNPTADLTRNLTGPGHSPGL